MSALATATKINNVWQITTYDPVGVVTPVFDISVVDGACAFVVGFEVMRRIPITPIMNVWNKERSL